MAELDSLLASSPPSIKQREVDEFHAILDRFSAATGEDITDFKIDDSEVKPEIASLRPRSYSGRPGFVKYTEEKYCDRNLFERKLNTAKRYFANFQPPHESK